MASEIGPRQTAILDLLATGPHSLDALIAAVDPGRPQVVLASLKRLVRRGLVTVTGRKAKGTEGAVVALTLR